MKTELNDLLVHPMTAALLGAIVGLKAIPGTSVPEKLVNVAVSFALASYGGPALTEYMDVSSPRLAAGMIFGVGAAGLVVFAGLLEAIKRADAFARLVEWALSWLPGRKQGGE